MREKAPSLKGVCTIVPLDIDMERYVFSDAFKTPLESRLESQQYNNLPFKQNKAENESYFVTLGQISEEEKIEILQTGFQLNRQGKVSLKKYYESTDPNSLFQLKGYSIKYESIRRTKLYQQLKANFEPNLS